MEVGLGSSGTDPADKHTVGDQGPVLDGAAATRSHLEQQRDESNTYTKMAYTCVCVCVCVPGVHSVMSMPSSSRLSQSGVGVVGRVPLHRRRQQVRSWRTGTTRAWRQSEFVPRGWNIRCPGDPAHFHQMEEEGT